MTTNNKIIDEIRNECDINDFDYSCKSCERYDNCLESFGFIHERYPDFTPLNE